jgi:hypothetical protein
MSNVLTFTLALAMTAAAPAMAFPPLKRVCAGRDRSRCQPAHPHRAWSEHPVCAWPTNRTASAPASTVGVVTEGSFKFQCKGEPLRILKTGDTFFEPANHVILHFDNASGTKAAAITVFYLTGTKERPLIELLDPKTPAPGQ